MRHVQIAMPEPEQELAHVRALVVEDYAAVGVYEQRHGVEVEEELVLRGNDVDRVKDGREVEPERERDPDEVADVMEEEVEGRKRQREPEGESGTARGTKAAPR